MQLKLRRPRAAFFLPLFFTALSSTSSVAAPRPETPPKQINLNQQSVERPSKPVILKRDGNAALPDISDIFGGYQLDELPKYIPTIAPRTNIETTTSTIDEDGLLILELSLGKTILNDSLTAYREGDMLLLPIGQLADALQFPIQIDLDAKRAEGWFSEEDKTFLLDAARSRITISGQVASVDSQKIALHEDDIYVDSTLLSEWFSVDFNPSFNEQTLAVAGKNNMVLPAERFAEREVAREALKLKPSDASGTYPIVREPYHLATVPFASATLSSNFDERIAPSHKNEASLITNGDFLYMHQSSYLAYDDKDGIRNARFTLSRKDPEGKLFRSDEALTHTWLGEAANKAEFTNITLGDMFSTQLPLTMLNQNGRGVMVTNQPLDRNSRFDRTTIRGDVQPDWDVELYRNDDLLAFQRSNSNGRYEFNDVPLFTGLNIIRLVFYGPFGQTREEIRRILVNQNITEQGKSYVRFTALQQSKSLLGNTTSQGAFASNFLIGQNNIPISNTEGESRYAFEYEYGLRNNLALYSQFTHTPITGTLATDAATIGLGGVWEDVYGRIDVAQANSGGRALQLTTQTDVLGLNVSLEHQEFDDFLSDFTESVSDPVVRRSTGRVDGSLDLHIIPRLSLGVAAARTNYTSGHVRDELNQRTTSQLFNYFSVNHNTTFTRDTYTSGTPDSKQARGSLLVSAPLFGAYIRGGGTYGISPKVDLESVALAVDYSFSDDLIARSEVFRQISGDKVDTITTSLTKRFEQFSLSGSVGGDSKGNKQAGISFGFSFGMEPRTGKWASYVDPISQSGLVTARSFIDENQNKVMDAGEIPIENARYLINGNAGSKQNQDDFDGAQLLKFIPENELAAVVVNPSSVEDPYVIAGDSGVRVVARAGVATVVDFPLTRASDVEGLVTISQDSVTKEAANVLIEAVDSEGKVVRSTRSAFDGVYLLELLPSGSYTIRVSEEQTHRLGFKHTTSKPLTVRGNEEIISDVDLQITR
jgi:hypothetical protein